MPERWRVGCDGFEGGAMSTAVRHLRPLADPAAAPVPGDWPTPPARDEPHHAPASAAMGPRPVHLVVDGIAMLLACPPPPVRHEQAQPCADQPMLPLREAPSPGHTAHGGPHETPEDTGIDLQRAEQWVAGLAHAVCEVLGRRRPAHQLRGVLDEESLALVAAWARLGTLCPEGMGRPHLQVTSPDRIEGWLSCGVHGRRLAVALSLERRGERWRCTGFRVLAPRALTTRAA